MNLKSDKIIGIVGGMGPQAGIALFNTVLRHTKATVDQQHLSVALISFPKHIGDRTAFLNGSLRINPAFNIVKIISKLETLGAKVVGIACNTSYSPAIYNVVLSELAKINSRLRVVNMPFETCNYIKQNYPLVNRVGLMATNGTYKSEVYKNQLKDLGYDVVIPDFKFQNSVIHKMIYDRKSGIKANTDTITKETGILLQKAICFFKENKTDAIILGCTELSLALTEKSVNNMLIIDSAEVLAMALIREVIGNQDGKPSRKFTKRHFRH